MAEHASWCNIHLEGDLACDCGPGGETNNFLEGHDPSCEGHHNGAHLCDCGYEEVAELEKDQHYDLCLVSIDAALEAIYRGEYEEAKETLEEVKRGTPNP